MHWCISAHRFPRVEQSVFTVMDPTNMEEDCEQQEKLYEINYRDECEKLQRQIECETLKRLLAEQRANIAEAMQDNFKKQLGDNIRISAEEENRHPVVTAVPWDCQRCNLQPEVKKSKAVVPKALTQRRARKLLAKFNAEQDGAGSDTEIPIAVRSKNVGRPKGPKPVLYTGSTEDWHALTIDERKVISRRIKRLSVYAI